MNAFLAPRVRRALSLPQKLALGTLGPFALLMGWVSCSFLVNDPGTALVGAMLTGLMAWPVVRILRRYALSRQALRLAARFELITAERISLSALSGQMQIRRLVPQLKRLIDGGYLQNVHIDFSQNALVFATGNRAVEGEAYVLIECPNCGAQNKLRQGRTGRCSFCEGELIPHAPQASMKGD